VDLPPRQPPSECSDLSGHSRVLLATFFPVAWVLYTPPGFKASVLILSLVALAFLPALLPCYLTPNRRIQAQIREWSYVTLGGFFLSALI
jgi:hypothetical protein